MKLAIFSDTHFIPVPIELPVCDIAICCGDVMGRGEMSDAKQFADWYRAQPATHKIYVPGNHDWPLQVAERRSRVLLEGITVLIEQEAEIAGLKIYGTPFQPWFNGWAFNVMDKEELEAHYAKIPEGLDILVTHCPPYGVMDHNRRREHCGSGELSGAVYRARPRLHVFGHIHEAYSPVPLDRHEMQYVNAAICSSSPDESRQAVVMDFFHK
jgi:Icc-related predicted phosphoesterase